ncbi:MAG: HAD family hydrolase [Clostridiales bacterium]|nr:HAD family hydrolase [Clostridiales bacterium]
MRKINYRLFVSDFDGTLAKKDCTISEETKRTINEYVENGGTFVVSTGRMPTGILPYLRDWGFQGVVSCYQGSVIMDIESGEPLLSGVMDKQTVLKACEIMEELGLHIHLYTLQGYYTNKRNEVEEHYEKLVLTKGGLVENMSDFIKTQDVVFYKILAIVFGDEIERARSVLQEKLGDSAEITMSADCLLEVCNPNYDKGTALRFLSEYYGVPMEKTFAVGDQFNDIPMIETAGLGATVKNGKVEVKARAKVVCEYSNEEDAVARLIKKYGYLENEI